MSDSTPAASPAPLPAEQSAGAVTAPVERVGLGLLASLGAVVIGIVISVVLWRIGFIASISSFVIAAGAVMLYIRAAGALPRRGLAPLIIVIVTGVVLSFLAVVASDLSDVYDQFAPADAVSKPTFVMDNIFRGEVLGSYGKDMAFFALFAALGMYRTLRGLVTGR